MVDRVATRRRVELFLRYWLPVFGYLALVQIVALQPDFQVPQLFPNIDKVIHVFEYLGLGLLLARASRASFGTSLPLRTALVAVVLGVCLGTMDEIVQAYVPNRQSSVNDLLADATGLLFAQVIYLFAVRE